MDQQCPQSTNMTSEMHHHCVLRGACQKCTWEFLKCQCCIKSISFNVWVRYFVWNFKIAFWNWNSKMWYPYIERCVLSNKLRHLRLKSLWSFLNGPWCLIHHQQALCSLWSQTGFYAPSDFEVIPADQMPGTLKDSLETCCTNGMISSYLVSCENFFGPNFDID